MADRTSELSEQYSIIRENVHKRAKDFGYVVSEPARALHKELVEHPEFFSVEERRLITIIFEQAIEDAYIFQSLGKPLSFQLQKLENDVISHIRNNVESFNSLLKNEKLSAYTLSWLQSSILESEKLVDGLEKIEQAGYGKSEAVQLARLIKSYVTDRNGRAAQLGDPIYNVDYFFGEFYYSTFFLNPESFELHVLGHIFDNFDKYAFSGEEYVNGESVKNVCINFIEDESDDSRVNIIIRNDGHPFAGDTNAVFEKGVGHGTGLGLFSARRLIETIGGAIQMQTYVNEQYTVGILINLPIYGRVV